LDWLSTSLDVGIFVVPALEPYREAFQFTSYPHGFSPKIPTSCLSILFLVLVIGMQKADGGFSISFYNVAASV
jgi:hypothetical protein